MRDIWETKVVNPYLLMRIHIVLTEHVIMSHLRMVKQK
jgi:hypothetical protein